MAESGGGNNPRAVQQPCAGKQIIESYAKFLDNTVSSYRELAELYLRQQKLTEAKELLEKASGLVDDESIRALYDETSPAVPSFSVAPGAYDTRQAVSIAPAKETHTIYYTLDGTSPTKDAI